MEILRNAEGIKLRLSPHLDCLELHFATKQQILAILQQVLNLVLMVISPYNLQAVDPNNGLIELPENLTDAADRISAGCASDEEARFVTSGRGGLPVNPRQKLQHF
ncbi:MAG: hypothetical protein AAF915_19225 [Cyanobacteria bacterium P01_D01_bin.50]